MGNSVVFRLNYLVGVNKNILEKEFPKEFKESEKLKLFENYPGAKILRSLNRLRQSIFADYAVYQRKVQDVNAFNGVVSLTEDLSYLKQMGIDIRQYYKDLSLFRYCNLLTRMINQLVYKVLVELEMPYIDEMLVYFNMPAITRNDLDTLVSKASEPYNPYKIVIHNGEKIRQSLKYALHTDKNCIYSAFSLVGKSVSNEIVIPSFVFSKEKCEDVDPEGVINANELFKIVKSETIGVHNRDVAIRGYSCIKNVEETIEEVEVEQNSSNVEQVESYVAVEEKDEEPIVIKATEKTEVESPAVSIEEHTVVEEHTVIEDRHVVEEKDFNTPIKIKQISERCVDFESFSAEKILKDSSIDNMTYSVLYSVIALPIISLVNLKTVKQTIISSVIKNCVYTEKEISDFVNAYIDRIEIEVKNSEIVVSLNGCSLIIS